MLEDVVRAVHPVKLPPGTLHISYQVGAGHFCVWYTLIVIDANIGALITRPPRAAFPVRAGRRTSPRQESGCVPLTPEHHQGAGSLVFAGQGFTVEPAF